MGIVVQPDPVKLICPVLKAKDIDSDAVIEKLTEAFGPADFISDIFPFEWTDYYDHEMGSEKERFFVSFEKLIAPQEIVQVKLKTNQLEMNFLDEETNGRRVNLDPGYMEMGKFILATTKNFTHRIYLFDGIYAEVTLMFQKKKFCDLPWTYPDYRSDIYKKYLYEIRNLYRQQLAVR